MKTKSLLTASIVAYQNPPQLIGKAIESFLETDLAVHLWVIDNSPTPSLASLCEKDTRITYIFNAKNVGFGAGHNLVLRNFLLQKNTAPLYHLVLNPDVYFEKGTLENTLSFMEQHKDVGLLMPKVLYPDGQTQYLCKLLPTPFDLFSRRFLGLFFKKMLQKHNEHFEMRFSGYNKLMDVPYLSGCFMFLRMEALEKVGIFDERIFMYMEDTDLTRRIAEKYRTVFYPQAQIFHHFQKGSYKSQKLLAYNLHGAWVYFNKWGWFCDKKRQQINRETVRKVGLLFD